ncbi:MAG TPA: nucleotidyltransferase domain-containing protein [Kofleriaceae bacterium]|nr:nucleotidyltransferase domain-containing protein [Kofleriaceae bacterium]
MVATRVRDVNGHALDVRPIELLLERIVTEFRPLEVRLFGSRARGEAAGDSDWDLFVVVPDDSTAVDDLFAGYRLRRETRTRADVILCPVSEFVEDRSTPNTLAYEAAHHGVTIYER